MTDLKSAQRALRSELEDVAADNPVAATRRVARIARRFEPQAATSWEAFRFAAVQELRPYFEARKVDPAKAAVWAVVDPYYGQLDRGEQSTPPRDGHPPNRSGSREASSKAGSVPSRELPDPSEGGQAGREEGAA